MLAFFQTLIPFIAVCVLALFTSHIFKISSGISVFAVLCATMVYFTLFGCLGLLTFGIYFYYAICIACFVLLILAKLKTNSFKLTSPAFLIFAIMGFALIAYFAYRQPVFTDWDDFSLWGTAAKMTSYSNKLYVELEFGWPWNATQKPGFIVLSYFFNFFGGFAPWRTFAAYDLFMFSAFAAAVGSVRFKKWYVATPIFLTLAILPFINIATRMIYLTTPYLNAYADIPMGIAMGGIFAFYFHTRETKNTKALFLLPFAACAVTLCKDTGMPLALLAVAVIAMDMFICEKNSDFVVLKPLKGLWTKIIILIISIVGVGISFAGWNKYLAKFGAASANLGGESYMSASQLIINGVLMLFGLTPLESGLTFTDKFAAVQNNMVQSFLYKRITFLGTGLMVFGLIFIVLLISWFATTNNTLKKRIACYGVFGTLSFIPYYCFIGFTYVFIFKGDQGTGLIDYNRYMGSYYVALLVGAFALFALSAAGECRKLTLKQSIIMCTLGMITPCVATLLQMIADQRRVPAMQDFIILISLFAILGFSALYGMFKNSLQLTSLLALAIMLFVFEQKVPYFVSVIGYPEVVYDDYRLMENSADQVTKHTKDKRVFFIDTSDTGQNWFAFSYYFYPSILDYSWGGGSISDNSVVAHNPKGKNITIGQFASYLYTSDCEYLYIYNVSDEFKQSYQTLFESEILPRTLYKINKQTGGIIVDKEPIEGQNNVAPNSLSLTNTVPTLENIEDVLSLSHVYTEVVQ